jgi:hypothetical protein
MSQLKIKAARRQLGTALHLYLRDLDPVSVHCLANGGCELIEFYAEKAGGKPFTSHILQTVTDTDIEEIRMLQRQYWTAFKHATYGKGKERIKDDALLKRFTDEENDAALFIGWHDYARATKTMPIEAQAHQIWYLALHPDKLDPNFSIIDIERTFPNLPNKSRAKQKRMLNKLIDKYRADKKLMRHSGTDARPLVLAWLP